MKTPKENDYFVFEVEDVTPENFEQMKHFVAFIDEIIAKAVEKALKEIKE